VRSILRLRFTALFVLALALYGLLASWQARTGYAWDNEAWFADPALNLLNKGFMGTTILESKGTWMEGLDRHTYWILPLHVLAQVGWYKIFGFSLLTLRTFSIVCGLLLLCAWYSLMSRLFRDLRIALLTVGLLAVDTHFLSVAALGRMDVMCAGLGWAGCAAYVCLRERNLWAALLLGNVLVAASCFTHPCGVLYFIALSVLTLCYDRSRLGLRKIVVAAAPYAMGVSAWGVYILQNPAQFWSQFSGNASGIASEFTGMNRWAGLRSPFGAFFWEVRRYLGAFDWYVATTFWERFQVSILALYALGIVAALCTPSIRRKPGSQVLLSGGFLFFFLMAVFEGLKSSPYIVHTLPIAAALLAVSLASFLWADGSGHRPPWTRRAAVAILIAFLGLQLFYGIENNRMPRKQWDYAAMLGFLKNHATPSSQIVGGAELAFQLGFSANLIDDPRLGYYSGKRPDFIVANSVYRGWFKQSQARYPEIYRHIQQVLSTSYQEVFHNASYTVYQRAID
jgi:4-amino-4-deoxy-L-arabinose transferase-like glycosyltransferase